jgi:hypothetical protein
MTIPKALPSYVTLDPSSPWHLSGLLSTAQESITLPSRLRGGNGKRESLDEIAAALNVNGNQNIAKLQMSIDTDTQTNGDHTERPETGVGSRDMRMPSQNGHQHEIDDLEDAKDATFDMEFFPSGEAMPILSRGHRRKAKKTHIFGQVEGFRGPKEMRKQEGDFDGQERARRRAAGLPIIHKSVTPFTRRTLVEPQASSYLSIYINSLICSYVSLCGVPNPSARVFSGELLMVPKDLVAFTISITR